MGAGGSTLPEDYLVLFDICYQSRPNWPHRYMQKINWSLIVSGFKCGDIPIDNDIPNRQSLSVALALIESQSDWNSKALTFESSFYK